MLKSKWILSTSLAMSAVMSAGVTSNAHASQYVADLVPSEWKVVERAVEVRQKMYSSNLYGNSAEFQMMFLNNGTPALFDMTQLSVNSDSFSCRLPAGEDLGGLDSAYTQICSFVPKLLLTNPGSLEAVPDYWMRVKFNNLAGRSVKLRHLQPVSPHCDAGGNPAAYNRLNSCTTMSSTITINNNQLHKPRLSMYGKVWAPLVLKNNTYKVTLKVSNGSVRMQHGLKMKVSGSINADPNDEMLEGPLFTDSCTFEEDATLANGTHVCTFTAADDGFVHMPLKRVNSSKTPKVITTIENLTEAGTGL